MLRCQRSALFSPSPRLANGREENRGASQSFYRSMKRRRSICPKGVFARAGQWRRGIRAAWPPLSGSGRVLVTPAVRRCGQRSWAAASSGAKRARSVRAVHATLSSSRGTVAPCQLLSEVADFEIDSEQHGSWVMAAVVSQPQTSPIPGSWCAILTHREQSCAVERRGRRYYIGFIRRTGKFRGMQRTDAGEPTDRESLSGFVEQQAGNADP